MQAVPSVGQFPDVCLSTLLGLSDRGTGTQSVHHPGIVQVQVTTASGFLYWLGHSGGFC